MLLIVTVTGPYGAPLAHCLLTGGAPDHLLLLVHLTPLQPSGWQAGVVGTH